MIRICHSLQAKGHQVLLVGRQKKQSQPLQKQDFRQKRFRLLFERGKFFYLEYNFRLFIFLLFAKVDVIYSVDLDTLLPGALIAKYRNKKIVYDAHEYFTELPELEGRPVIKAIWQRLAKHLIPRTDKAITVAESLAAIFEKEYGKSFVVIRNLPSKFTLTSPQHTHFQSKSSNTSGRKVILYQGVLNVGRGLEEMISVIGAIDGIELWLAGEGDLSDKLRRLVKAAELEDRVIFLGYLFPNDLKKVTSQADIGINLLQNLGLNYYYSLANKAFDYIQAGVPSIHMDFPEYRRINAQFEVFELVPNLETATLAKAIQKLIFDTNHYVTMQQNCLQAAEQLNWEAEEQKLLTIFKDL